MFEKEADSYANGFLKLLDWKQFDQHDKVVMFSAFKDGAEFGYNKAKKDINVATRWHKVADGDLPKEKKLYLATTKEGSLILAYYNGTYWETKYNTNVMGHALEIIVAWCELPKYTEE
jgi:hypothetical protein